MGKNGADPPCALLSYIRACSSSMGIESSVFDMPAGRFEQPAEVRSIHLVGGEIAVLKAYYTLGNSPNKCQTSFMLTRNMMGTPFAMNLPAAISNPSFLTDLTAIQEHHTQISVRRFRQITRLD